MYINKISTNVGIDIRLEEKEADSYDEETHTYTFLIGRDKEDYELSIFAKNDNTKLEFEKQEYETLLRETVRIEKEEEGKSYIVKVTSESGNEQEYTIDIIHISNNTNLWYLKVNDEEREPDVEGGDTYTVIVPMNVTSSKIEVLTEHAYAKVRIGDTATVKQHSTAEIDCSEEKGDKIVVPIVVKAADGVTIRNYFVVLVKAQAVIQGRITTENYEQRYTAKVKLYKRKREDEEDLDDEGMPVTEVDTKEDGSYVLDITEEGSYDVVIEKTGYLSYTLANIEITPGLIVEIEEHKLIAGDVVEDGEIEIADLVELNANLGIEITEDNKEEIGKYDLNEDGTVDMTDRSILKSNYGKKEETEIWVNPASISTVNIEQNLLNENAIKKESIANPNGEFALPLACKYRISSDYGERVNPITGQDKLHAGIDIVGEHHTEILSIAEGEVTYAGVQNGYGNCIEIKHVINGETIYSFYAHLSRIDVKVGDKVEKGQVIGLEGGAEEDPNHGNSTGHHLHFELRSATGSGHSIDPREYLRF